MKIRIVPHQRTGAAWNLALEEALFLKAKQDVLQGKEVQPIIKLYSFKKPSVILGYRQKISEIDYDYCKEQNVDVTMRTTGGGSVYLGKNDLQYSLILPQQFNQALLKKINTGIIHGLEDAGLSPELKIVDNHSAIRIGKDKHFVFDAQRRFKNLLLHHGTILVDNNDYEHMPNALKATKAELQDLQSGNTWLKDEHNVREKELIKGLNKNLPEAETQIKDFTGKEIKLAKQLYKSHYTNEENFTSGKKKFGICYLPSTTYDMKLYTTKDD